jgi:uncharacterized lipoprotein NlpE involved in copper resistance
MKKLVIAALLATGSLALYSCNNGAYDADPKVSGSPLNPLNPKESGVSVYLGTMRADLNGTTTLFSPAYYTVDESGAMNVIAFRVNDKDFRHTLRFSIYNFKNTKEFSYGVAYTYLDTSKHSVDSFFTYGTHTSTGAFTLTMNGNEEGNLRGNFSGTLAKLKPVENVADVIKITNGEYYVPKK